MILLKKHVQYSYRKGDKDPMKKLGLSILVLMLSFSFVRPVSANQKSTEMSFQELKETAIREGKQLSMEEYERITSEYEGEELEEALAPYAVTSEVTQSATSRVAVGEKRIVTTRYYLWTNVIAESKEGTYLSIASLAVTFASILNPANAVAYTISSVLLSLLGMHSNNYIPGTNYRVDTIYEGEVTRKTASVYETDYVTGINDWIPKASSEQLGYHGYIHARGFVTPGNLQVNSCVLGLLKQMTGKNFNGTDLYNYANYGQQQFYRFDYDSGTEQEWKKPFTSCAL